MSLRIAAWSGPRNISTAMMRAFENRPDATASDEPLYAAYLAATGLDHPGRDAILGSQPTDPAQVTSALSGPIPGGATVWYQKHMTHHLLDTIERGWMASLRHVFLIRSPRRVVASYALRRGRPTLLDLGFVQQSAIYQYVRDQLGQHPPVLDADDVLRDPAGMLSALCAHLGIPFSTTMLQWPAGPRPTDGVWAPHWYDRVLASTGFAPYRPRMPDVRPDLEPLVEAATPLYDALYTARLRPAGPPPPQA